MDTPNLDEYYDVCYKLTKECGLLVSDAILKVKNITTKSCEIDLVTETDQEVERLLIGGLKKSFPTHKFIGEESTASGVKCVLTDEPTWIIDPVDGTMNFVHGLPLVAISIGLLINKQPVLGIVYNPILDQMFTAKIGQGAFFNGNPMRVSGETEMSKALICTEMGSSKEPEKIKVVLSNLTKLIGNVHGVRCLGSAAMNMATVASGGADAYYEFGIHAWDMAASVVIVSEAGGAVLDTAGGPFDLMSRRVVVASSLELAKSVAGVLDQIELERD